MADRSTDRRAELATLRTLTKQRIAIKRAARQSTAKDAVHLQALTNLQLRAEVKARRRKGAA